MTPETTHLPGPFCVQSTLRTTDSPQAMSPLHATISSKAGRLKLGVQPITALLIVAVAAVSLNGTLHPALAADADVPPGQLQVHPDKLQLTGRLERAQIVVTRTATDGIAADLTRQATYTVADPKVAQVDSQGLVRPLANGQTTITIESDGESRQLPLTVAGIDETNGSRFTWHVIPMLNRAGCTGGGCHAAQFGQAGFKLSLLGYAPEQDYPEIAEDRFARRINQLEPDQSLFLKKPTLQVPHGGGRRFTRDSYEYQVLRAWIDDGAPAPPKEMPHVVDLEVFPTEQVFQVGQSQQLRVEAVYANGTRRDVTTYAMFDCQSEAIASVTDSGSIKARGPGQTAVMIRFMGQAKVTTVVVPYRNQVDLAQFHPANFVDELAKQRWQRLGLQPVGICDDTTFIRRAFLDAIGTLPEPQRVREFLADSSADKRERLVDELLGLTGDPKRDRYIEPFSAYWALKWGDLLRNNRTKLGDGGMWAMYNWLRNSFRENKPIDELVREIITAQGSVFEVGPANYYKIAAKPEDLAETTAQVFLGIRLACARCHHHPFEVYSQQDYYSLAAFFTRVGTKASAEFGALGGDTVVVVRRSGAIRHPRTKQVMQPTPLQGEPVKTDGIRDLRRPLAQWLTSPENRLFARNIANRTWSYFMATGLVEPVDDMRATNPASNPELLEALAGYLVEHNYDIRQLMRVIMTSRVYQLESDAPPELAKENRFYTHYNVKRLPAEVMLDAVNTVAGTQDKFPGIPAGTRAIELPDPNYSSYFLDTMGRPPRAQACECERQSAPNLAQVLHLVNGDAVNRKIADKQGALMKWLADKDMSNADIVERLYLAAYSRLPAPNETAACEQLVAAAPSRQEGWQDVLWAILNSREFLFNH